MYGSNLCVRRHYAGIAYVTRFRTRTSRRRPHFVTTPTADHGQYLLRRAVVGRNVGRRGGIDAAHQDGTCAVDHGVYLPHYHRRKVTVYVGLDVFQDVSNRAPSYVVK